MVLICSLVAPANFNKRDKNCLSLAVTVPLANLVQSNLASYSNGDFSKKVYKNSNSFLLYWVIASIIQVFHFKLESLAFASLNWACKS